MWDLYLQHLGSSSLIRVEPRPPALGVQSLSHWTIREVPLLSLEPIELRHQNHVCICPGLPVLRLLGLVRLGRLSVTVVRERSWLCDAQAVLVVLLGGWQSPACMCLSLYIVCLFV